MLIMRQGGCGCNIGRDNPESSATCVWLGAKESRVILASYRKLRSVSRKAVTRLVIRL